MISILNDERLSVGIRSIDDEHRALIVLIRDLARVLEQGEAVEARNLFAQLRAALEEHHADEEALMQRHRYPKLEEHAAGHRATIKALEAARSILVRKGLGAEAVQAAECFIEDYLSKAFIGDQEMKWFFLDHGIDPGEV